MLSKFNIGDVITIKKPANTAEGPAWNESDITYNMDYLQEGEHVIEAIGTYIRVLDYRTNHYWSIDPRWCTLVKEASPHIKVINKIKRMQIKRKEMGYAF